MAVLRHSPLSNTMSEASDTHYDAAVDALESGNLAQALEEAEKSLAEEEGDAASWRLYALILTALQRSDEAAKASARADKLDGGEPGLESFLQKAAAATVEGRISSAISNYEDALELDETRYDIWINYALVLIHEGYKNDAMEASEKAVNLKGDNPHAWYVRGRILRLCEEFDDAMLAFQKAIDLDSSLAVAWHERGMVLCGREEFDEALACFEKVLEMHPGDPGATQAIEITRAQMGQD